MVFSWDDLVPWIIVLSLAVCIVVAVTVVRMGARSPHAGPGPDSQQPERGRRDQE